MKKKIFPIEKTSKLLKNAFSMKIALVIIKTKEDLISVTLSLIVKNAKGERKREMKGKGGDIARITLL